MAKKFFYILLILIPILAGIHFYWMDGVGYAILEFIFGRTEYSSGYSEYAFRFIKNGMTVEEVVKLLGEPLFKTISSDGQKEIWFYSFRRKDAYEDYTQRIIKFDNSYNNPKKVIEIHHEYYFD